jgi:hypothetical protein
MMMTKDSFLISHGPVPLHRRWSWQVDQHTVEVGRHGGCKGVVDLPESCSGGREHCSMLESFSAYVGRDMERAKAALTVEYAVGEPDWLRIVLSSSIGDRWKLARNHRDQNQFSN